MKTIGNKTKTLVSSFVSLGVAASLIAGSTFALFTSESHTDIAITSGKVSLSATAQITKVYSAKWDEGKHNYIDDEVAHSGAYTEGETYSFTNGGTAMYSGKTLTLNNLSAGDGVKFQINVENKSTISIKYQTVVTFVNGGNVDGTPSEDEAALYKALKIKVNGDEDISSNRTTAVSDWTTVPTAEGAIDPIEVDIHLPWNVDGVQGMTCNIVIGVYAVQSNGHDETKKDVYFINKESNIQDVLKNMENGGIIAAGEAMTFTEDNSFAVPKDRDVILDVNGNAVEVNKEAKTGESLVVPEGSTLTVTNSAEDGSLNLNANADAGNWSNGSKGNYTLRVEEGGTLNFEDVRCTLKNEDMAEANHIVYVGGGTLNCSAGTEIEFTGSGFADGFLVREGGTMNVTDTTFHSTGAVGQITVGYVGGAEVESTLNINEGTEIVYENANSMAGAIIVNGTGNVNIHEGSSITVRGEIPKEYDSQSSTWVNSAAAAIRVVGGGNVIMDGGTINLETTTTNGWAFAVMVLNTIFADPEVGGGKVVVGYAVDAHIEFTGNATIIANEHAYIFAAQKNAELRFKTTADGTPNPNDGYQDAKFTMKDGKLVPTIVVRDGVTITAQGEVVKKGDTVFAQDSGEQYENVFGYYSPNAIEDNRKFD